MDHPDPSFTGADNSSPVTAGELRRFVETIEAQNERKAEIAAEQKETYAEAKGRGYDTKVIRKLIAERKRKPDDLAEEQAVLELYRNALARD